MRRNQIACVYVQLSRRAMKNFCRVLLLGATLSIVGVAQSSAPNSHDPGNAPTSVAEDPGKDLAPSLKQFLDVLGTVQTDGAEPQPLDKMIYEGAIPAMLRELDPHTQFFDPAQFQQLQEMEQSEQKGFGSVVSVLPGQVIFLQTLPGTPSNKAGIQPGDELVAVNNIAIGTLEPEQIIQLLTQARQQKVAIFVRRQGDAKILRFVLTPALVDEPSVDRAFMLRPGYGYIRIASWDLDTATQLQNAIQKLGGNSLEGLVMDLRNNPGRHCKSGARWSFNVPKTGATDPDRERAHRCQANRRRTTGRRSVPF